MYTDIVGYTSLAQKDEYSTLQALEKHRGLLRPLFSSHGGREIKTIGDAFLVEFQSALDALLCSVAIQQMMHDRRIARGEAISIRIGIHVGDVIESGNDILGDAVNIASRIEPIAGPEGICVSQQVYDQVQNKFDLPLVPLGEKAMKNVNRPVQVYSVQMPWEPHVIPREETLNLPRDRIAILPFANMSPDPNDEYFADGMTEEIISTVSGISGLSVISRTSVMRYKQTSKGTTEIGRELKAGRLLEGSVRKSGNRVRITVQLIDSESDAHLWAQSYDRNMEDIFATQSDIARKIANALKLSAPGQAESRMENVDVYNLCLKARSLWNKRTKEANEQAILLFEDALKIDRDSSRATAGLADCYFIAADWQFTNQEEGYAKAKQLVKRAIELDETSAEAYATLGMMLYHEHDYDNAEKELKKAISLNPNYATAHQWYSTVLLDVGKFDEGMDEIRKANELDPLSPSAMFHLMASCYYAGNLDDAMATCTKLIQSEPGFANAYLGRSILNCLKGKKDDALRDLQTYRRLTNRELEYKIHWALLEAVLGNRDGALKLVEEVLPLVERDQSPEALDARGHLGEVYAVIGDKAQFFKWAEYAVDRHVWTAGDLRYDPVLQDMRQDPRFAELFKKLGLSR
jgi:TolB-like protein/Tfp pilus assembly protein PilF